MDDRMFLAPPTLLVGPPGVGKKTVLRELLHRRACGGPTLTNRPPRTGLDTGCDFLHISSQLMDALLRDGALTDDVSITQQYSYAVCHAVKVRGENRCPLFVTDADTARLFRSEMPCHIVQILPGDAAELAKRLNVRKDMNPERLKEHLKKGRDQIADLTESGLANFTVINTDLQSVIGEMEGILDRLAKGSQCMTHYREAEIQQVLDSFDELLHPQVTLTGYPITEEMLDVQNKMDALFDKVAREVYQAIVPKEGSDP